MRVSPAPPLPVGGHVLREHLPAIRPLLLLFVLFVFGLPTVGVHASFFNPGDHRTVVVYRGIRLRGGAIGHQTPSRPGRPRPLEPSGWTFTPDVAVRRCCRRRCGPRSPPIGSLLIALTRNSSVAEAFGTKEATYVLDSLGRDNARRALLDISAELRSVTSLSAWRSRGGFRLLERRLAVGPMSVLYDAPGPKNTPPTHDWRHCRRSRGGRGDRAHCLEARPGRTVHRRLLGAVPEFRRLEEHPAARAALHTVQAAVLAIATGRDIRLACYAVPGFRYIR